jgi:hypothetical protein
MYIITKNKSRLEFPNFGKPNCNGDGGFYLGRTDRKANEGNWNLLATTKIVKIRVETSSDFIERSLTDEQAEYFIQQLSCVKKFGVSFDTRGI